MIRNKKNFWATVKLLLSSKIKSVKNVFENESGEVTRNKLEVANVFKNIFCEYVARYRFNHTDTSDDSLEAIIDKCKNHPSITYFLHLNLSRKIKLTI